MFDKSTVLFVSLSVLFATSNADVTSLFFPGPTGLALTAVNIGEDGDTTTWLVGPGKESGGLTPPAGQASFTLIEGPSQVDLISVVETGSATVNNSCVLNGGSDANCSWRTIGPNSNAFAITGATQVPRVPIQISDNGNGGVSSGSSGQPAGSTDTSSSAATSGAQTGNGGSGGSQSSKNSGFKVLAVGGTLAAASIFAAMGAVFGAVL